MLTLLVILVCVGVGLYMLNAVPMDNAIRILIRGVVILAAFLYTVRALGLLDVPLPRLR